MDDRFTKAEAALLMPDTTAASRRETDAEAIRLAAVAARDEAVAAWILGGLRAHDPPRGLPAARASPPTTRCAACRTANCATSA